MIRIMLICVFFLAGCTIVDGISHDTISNPDDLLQHWVHSREEDEATGGMVFRPAESRTFPTSRFSGRYIFREGGECKWFFLAPDDAHYFKDGTWRLDEERRLHIQQEDLLVSFKVISLTRQALVVERI